MCLAPYAEVPATRRTLGIARKRSTLLLASAGRSGLPFFLGPDWSQTVAEPQPATSAALAVVVDLDSEELFDYPFIYLIEPGGISLSLAEEENLRKYCLNGGFLMVDDFWGQREWDDFEWQMQRVFPGRKYTELELDHPIFSSVFKLSKKPQVPSLDAALYGRSMGVTYEYRGGTGEETPHYRAWFDDKGRMMCIACLNTDLGDGWEREGENHWYFKEFAEKWAYPMGINIVFYAMTH